MGFSFSRFIKKVGRTIGQVITPILTIGGAIIGGPVGAAAGAAAGAGVSQVFGVRPAAAPAPRPRLAAPRFRAPTREFPAPQIVRAVRGAPLGAMPRAGPGMGVLILLGLGLLAVVLSR